MPWREFVRRIRDAGRYDTDAEAERMARAVLALLGRHVTDEDGAELARVLPPEAGKILAAQIPVTEPLAAPAFVEAVADRLDSLAVPAARWGVSTVLFVIGDYAGEGLTSRILAGLPRGYALLFGRAELIPAA